MFTKILAPIAIALVVTQTAQANLDLMRKEMDAFQKPMVEALRNTLEKYPEFSKDYKQYQALMKPILTIKNPKEQELRADQLNAKYEAIFHRAMKKAKVDPEKSKKKAKELTAKYSFKDIQYILQSGQFLTYVMWTQDQRTSPPPVETEQVFVPPFEFDHSSSEGGGSHNLDYELGGIATFASDLIAGFSREKAGFGMVLRLNWEARRVRVSTTLGNIHYSVLAISGGGGSGAKASSVIDLVTEDQRNCVETIVHAEAIAPVMWKAEVEGDATTVFACEMDAPPRNQDLAIRFQQAAETTVGGIAGANASVRGYTEPIRARLIE